MFDSIQVRTDTPTPLYRQIHHSIAALIRSGSIPPGTRLPSTRDLAGRLGVTRQTALAAYDELAADGLVRGGVGKGTYVEPVGLCA